LLLLLQPMDMTSLLLNAAVLSSTGLDAVALQPSEAPLRGGWTYRQTHRESLPCTTQPACSHPRALPYLRLAATPPVIEYVFYFRHQASDWQTELAVSGRWSVGTTSVDMTD